MNDSLQFDRRWLALPAALLLLAACLLTSGCQEKSLPAAVSTHPASATTESGEKPAASPAQLPPIRDITFDTIKFNMRKEDPFVRKMLTPAIERLDGGRIRVRGYMLPTAQQSGLKRFVLVRDNQQCCFGPGAALYDSMIVDMGPETSTDFKVQPIMVEGTFNIREVRFPDGHCVAIYHLAAERAE